MDHGSQGAEPSVRHAFSPADGQEIGGSPIKVFEGDEAHCERCSGHSLSPVVSCPGRRFLSASVSTLFRGPWPGLRPSSLPFAFPLSFILLHSPLFHSFNPRLLPVVLLHGLIESGSPSLRSFLSLARPGCPLL